MYPGEFRYERAESVEHALDLVAENPGAEVLAGGHSLLPTMKSGLADPDVVIDISGIDSMQGIEEGDGATSVGALTSYADVAGSDHLESAATVVAEAAGEIGDVQVRNRGTVGGNVAHADPASDLPAAVLAADATLVAQGPSGEREIAADDFFLGMYATALGEDELLTRLELPHHDPGTVSAYVKKPSPASGYAMVGVAAVLDLDGDTVSSARVAANGVMDHAVRLSPVEDALAGESLDGNAVSAAAEVAGDDLDEAMMMDDIHASAEFRGQLLSVFTERAIERAAERADAAPTA